MDETEKVEICERSFNGKKDLGYSEKGFVFEIQP
jgi:hypothetical protein